MSWCNICTPLDSIFWNIRIRIRVSISGYSYDTGIAGLDYYGEAPEGDVDTGVASLHGGHWPGLLPPLDVGQSSHHCCKSNDL